MFNVNFDRNMSASKIMMSIILVNINNIFHTNDLLDSCSSNSFVTKHNLYDMRTLSNIKQQDTFDELSSD